MKHEIEQGLHEKLCAYVLGEASEEVRAEVEAALEGSAELREEKERLEKTIGLVQETLGGAEAEPAISAEKILADARATRRRPWYAGTAYRAAAGIAAVSLLGVLGYRAMHRKGDTDKRLLAYSSFPAEKELSGSKKLQEADSNAQDQRAASLGYTGKNQPVAAPGSEASSPAASDEKHKDLLAARTAQSAAAPSPTAPSPTAKDPLIDSSLLGQLDQQTNAGASVPSVQVERSKAEESVSPGNYGGNSYDGNTFGRGLEGRRAGPSPAPHTYKGPSDTVPSGNVQSSSVSAKTAYRTSGDENGANAGALASGGPAGRSDDFFVGNRLDPSEAKRLRDLGYAGEGRERERAQLLKETGYVGDTDLARDGRDSLEVRFRELDPAERDRWIENECQRILRGCRRLPNEKPRDMFFRFYGDNPFEITALDAQSTFSVDVDTASYALARRYLDEGHIPEKAQVRTEEFVNYFKPDVPHPTQGTFSIHTDLTPSRFSADKARSMLRVVVSGKEVSKQERKPLNLTFVVDVSGSMREQNRLEMVKHALRLLVTELGGGDNLAIVAFSNDARTVLPMTSVRNRGAIESALFPLQPENSTNSEAGLKLGYEIALANINPEAQNRVVFLSDGVANVGETDPAKLSESVKPIREKGVYLNTIGVGMNNHNDVLLEQLADKGDGVCNYIDSPDEAKRVIVDGFTGTFETIARDVKIQVEFDPAQVERYRLLGYENRAIADKDFRNDKIDAGEVGAGHQVTALYELELAAGATRTPEAQEKLGGLGYIDSVRPPATPGKPLAVVRLRWKAPRSVAAPTANEEATEIAQPVLAKSQTSFEGAGVGYRRAVVVAQFAEFLRRSIHARGESLDDLISEADKLEKETHDPDTGELVLLLHKSKSLILAALPKCDDLCDAIENLRRRELLRCELTQLERDQDKSRLAELEKQNLELEQRIRDLLRRKLEAR